MFGNHLAQKAKFLEQIYMSTTVDERRRSQADWHNTIQLSCSALKSTCECYRKLGYVVILPETEHIRLGTPGGFNEEFLVGESIKRDPDDTIR
jgi:hypothetical protein